MSNLVTELAQLIAQDNALLFVGAGLRRELGGTSILEQIAEALATRINYQRPDRSLPAVARDFEALRGRAALLRALQEEVEKLGTRPAPIHQLIADAVLPQTKVITTRFDRLLEQALDQFHKPYVLIKRDEDLVAFDEARVTLIKIMGDIREPESLVITEDDVDRFIRKLPTVSDLIRAFLATKTLIFIGYDLNSRHFRRFLLQVADDLGEFRRQSHAITAQPVSEADRRYWAAQKVEIHQQDPIAFLEALAPAVKTAYAELIGHEPEPEPQPLADLAAPPLPTHPYKALNSFQASDARIFSGRKEESQRLANRILGRRVTVLYGESGSGKTSLLQAGVGPLLAEQQALLAICAPAPDQPLAAVLAESLGEAGGRAGLQPMNADLAATIRQWQQTLGGPVVLAIDQFEQFFLVYDETERRQATDLLRQLREDRTLNLRVVLVVREDFLGRLQELESWLPGLLDVRFRLERLGREAARAAIVEPAKLFNATWEPALVERLLDDLDEEGGGVAPPHLQIICARLYDEAVKRARGGAVQITSALYEELGGAAAILGDYLDQAVLGLPAEQQPLARALLGALVSSSGVRQRLDLVDLARAAEVSSTEATAILNALARQRLVRVLQVTSREGGPSRQEYELAHDMLVPRIARWLGDDFWAAQKAREIVRLALLEWQARGRLPALDDLRLATAQHGRVRFSAAEIEMLYAAAVGYDQAVTVWQAALSEAKRRQVLQQLLKNADPQVRSRAASRLAALGGDQAAVALAEMALTDAESTVRQAAARAIATMVRRSDSTDGRQALARLVEATGRSAQAAAALAALTTVRDVEPASHDLLPAGLRGQVQRRVWLLRWRRHWPQILAATVQGVQGGFLGVGLGLGLVLGLVPVRANTSPGTILALIVIGFFVAGVIGGLAVGAGALAAAILGALEDRARPWRTWAFKALVSVLAFTPAWILLRLGAPASTPAPTSAAPVGIPMTAVAILLFGLLTAGVAAWQTQWAWPLRLLLTMTAGIVGFYLAGRLGLYGRTLSQDVLSILMMGAGTGLGFFAGLNPGFWRRGRTDGT